MTDAIISGYLIKYGMSAVSPMLLAQMYFPELKLVSKSNLGKSDRKFLDRAEIWGKYALCSNGNYVNVSSETKLENLLEVCLNVYKIAMKTIRDSQHHVQIFPSYRTVEQKPRTREGRKSPKQERLQNGNL